MASTSASSYDRKLSESQTPQESAAVEDNASKDANPGDPQSQTDQASKSGFDEEPEIFEPKNYEPEGSSKASGK